MTELDHSLEEFVNPAWKSVLQALNLDSFSSLWDVELEPFQAPNTERGGTSTVYSFKSDIDGCPITLFIKRQENYNCFDWRKPWRPMPVCEREWRNACHLQALGIGTIEPVYYGRRALNGGQAIFVTVGLEGYQPLIELDIHSVSATDREPIMRAAGEHIARLHQAGLVHHCLYGNHIFFRKPSMGGCDIRFIDLEKMRSTFFASRGLWRDFSSLYRGCGGWAEDSWRWLIQGYLGESTWSQACEQFNHKVMQKVGKKR
ncbi:lipopolysaccharide kinase InaA family protein [Maricurvus nonylphenolicus]|uniref:lipopolysaccharide kinase InaA family protein n=1 Tax=Maricurvus nonylphenolicus TaxID=1008307 RepID=UPI0036F23BF3